VIPSSPDRVARISAALDRRLGSVVAVCEAVRRRHNVSAILRSAEAFGLHEVHLVTQGFRPVSGAARGAERWLHRRRFDHVDESVSDLRARGFRIYVADFAPEAFSPETLPVDVPVALIFGSEMRGVSARARALADGVMQVPMYGLTASLNVSVSAAIALRTLSERRRALVGADLHPSERARFLAAWLEDEAAALRGFLARTEPGEQEGEEERDQQDRGDGEHG
jgi:tRNA (guanosine-2'-O-)-methyltransferase